MTSSALASNAVYSANPGSSSIAIIGDPDTDLITVSSTATTITIVDTGAGGITTAAPCAVVANTVTCPVDPGGGDGSVDNMSADLDAGDDSFMSTSPILANVFAGDGTDTLSGGSGDDFLNGQGDSDTIAGNAGDDQMNGENGAGTPANDVISGGPGHDILAGQGANDVLSGGDGPDEVAGGVGDDTVNGDAGDDEIEGSTGSDALNGGEGDDLLDDGGPADPLNPAITGTDVVNGGPGNDFAAYVREASVNLSLDNVANDGEAGEGDNLIDVEGVSGGAGDDVLTGDDVGNSLVGQEGNDVITGLGGSDSLDAGDGDDTLDGGAAADEYLCGDGVDLAFVEPSDDVDTQCERTGASVGSDDTVNANRKGKAKLAVSCPVTEGAACAGGISIVVAGKQVGKGSFAVPAGATQRVTVKLSKAGLKKLGKAGNTLFATVDASTSEPGGKSLAEEEILLKGKPVKPRRHK